MRSVVFRAIDCCASGSKMSLFATVKQNSLMKKVDGLDKQVIAPL